MRVFETESIWDAENQEWQEVYYVNGIVKTLEEYSEEVNKEVNPEEYEDDEMEEDDEVDNYEEDVFDIEGCKGCEAYQECLEKYEESFEDKEEFECDCIDCTLDRYVAKIQEINGGCPHCIREVLSEFLVVVVDHTS